jgi:A/G-specific adenine glycosylase
MLQQTRVGTVIPYYERFLKRYPTLEDLAGAAEDQVLDLWAGLGYYGRARNLRKAARVIRDEFDGRFPREYNEAIKLPGIGRYSASAILSIAFGRPHAVLDGNVRRFMTRYLAVREDVKGPVLKSLESLLADIASSKALVDSIGDFNQALMELGAVVCVPGEPNCSDCPFRKSCRAFSMDLQNELPKSQKRKAPKEICFSVAVIERDGSFLMCRNKKEVYLRGFWEFPKIEGRWKGAAFVEQLEKVHGLRISIQRHFQPVVHHITFRRLSFYPILSTCLAQPSASDYHWVEFGEKPYPVSSYIHKILRRVGRSLTRNR